jgi:hypothetical protein
VSQSRGEMGGSVSVQADGPYHPSVKERKIRTNRPYLRRYSKSVTRERWHFSGPWNFVRRNLTIGAALLRTELSSRRILVRSCHIDNFGNHSLPRKDLGADPCPRRNPQSINESQNCSASFCVARCHEMFESHANYEKPERRSCRTTLHRQTAYTIELSIGECDVFQWCVKNQRIISPGEFALLAAIWSRFRYIAAPAMSPVFPPSLFSTS